MRDKESNIYLSDQMWQKFEWNFGYGPETIIEQKDGLEIIIPETEATDGKEKHDMAIYEHYDDLI